MFQLYNYKLSTLAGWKLITFLSIFSSIFIAEHSFALSPQVVTSNESTLNQFKNNVFIELGTNTHEIDITALNDEYHTVMITSDDEDLVTATIQGNQLILTPQNDKVGATQIRINVNNSITASFTVFINSTIDRLMYQEGFERNNGQWFSMGNNSSWEWGTPNSTIINKAANGSDKAWKTNLDGNYNPQEQSYLISPLFDLSAVEKVKISFDLWWELTESIFVDPRDGVRLEYSTDLGESWHSLTNEGRSQNWYNEGNIPSFNGAGWAYEEGNEDYFPAFLESEKLGGESQVMFRFFLHSISHNPTEGFAFDNFSLQEVDYDLGIETVNVVHNNVQVGVPFSAEVTVKNYGTKALNNFNVSHQYNGAGEITITASNTMLAPNAETTITIDNLVFDRGGQQAIQFFVDQANDVFTINDEFNLEILPQSATDLKINSIEKPIVIAESVPFEVEVENIGSNALGAFSISYQLGEQPRGSVNFDQGVLAGATATVMVTGIVGEENGTFPLELRLSNDGDNSNNSITEDFTISPILSGLPYNENLENNDGSWVAGGFRSSWEYVNGNGGKVWKSDIESHYLNRKEVSYIVSPVFDFTDIAKMRLSMDIEYNIQNGRGGALMEYSTDLGKTWHLLGLGWYNHHRYDLNQYRPILHRDHWWAGNSNGFQRHTVENDQIGNQQHVVFRYRVEAQDSNQFSRDHEGFSFDNVTILSANHNLALTNILTDFAPANGNFELKVEVKNEGGKTQDNFKIAYQIDGGEVVEKNITTSITPNRSSIITLDDVEALTVGEHTVDVEIVLDKDFDKSNNTFSKDIQVLPIVSQFPYNEDFENDNGDWFAYGTNNSWEWGVATDQKQGNVWATNLDGHYNQEEKSYIVSPFFDISDLSNIDISFDSWWNITFERDYINARNDNVVFQYSIDQGVTWVDFHPNEESENWHNKVYHSHGPFFFGTVSYWSGSSLDESNSNDFVRSVSNLSTTNHFKKVVFRFSFNSFDHLNTAEGFSFDNVRIMEKINPPTNLVLSNTSTTQLTFNWDKVQNATSYEYELSTDRDHFEANISNRGMVMNAETVQISKLSPSTKYYFRVKAVNKLLESEFTNIIEGTTATNTTLEVPLNIVVSNTTTSQLTFTWEKVQDATSYEYELSTDRNDFNNNILTNGSISSGETIQFDNLSPASTYFFRVKAKNATTESAFSDIVEGTTTAIPTLDIPANLVVSNPTTTQLTFTWEKVQDATSYEYALSTDRDDFDNNILTQGTVDNGVSIDLENLSPASTYFFRVKAKNATTESAFSDIVEGTTTAIPTLDIPANLVVSNPTTTQLTFTWEKVQDATSYEYALSTDRDDFDNNILTQGTVDNGVSIELENLTPASTYFFRVKAKNATTESAFSDIVEGTTTAIPTLDIPANVVVSNPTTTQLTFNWEKVQDATSYEYELSTDRDDFENNISNKGMVMNATTVQFNNLSPASSYFFRVKAINSNTSSAFSDIIEGITEAIPTLDAPLNLVISNASTTQLTASWDKVENATSYDYEVSTDEHFTESQIIIKNSVNTTEVILENLVSSTTYFVRVKAKNEHVESDYSTTASLATIDVVSSIDDHFNSSIKVAPVPASQYIIITFDDNPRGQFVLFSLKNTSGQTVKEWNKVGQKSITLDINTLPSNIYLLQILIDGQYFTKKIMKK